MKFPGIGRQVIRIGIQIMEMEQDLSKDLLEGERDLSEGGTGPVRGGTGPVSGGTVEGETVGGEQDM